MLRTVTRGKGGLKMKKTIIILSSALLSFPVLCKEMIQIKGSDTIVNLVQRLSEEYMKSNKNVAIAVTGGGSGTGIAALINNKCDVANASRSIKDKEIKNAEENGITVKEFVIATDGLCIIVNKNNPVKKLTTDQVGKIYRGEITNWKQ
ncbi:MAG: substrate-binding domain-containing protein, partial [Oligoflexia bacterium]|nr:substrate-binding domain-containing protein [Oligoflexia bacterium]